MPYRINASRSQSCLVCSTSTKRVCRNCSGSHCELHMAGSACAGCQSELWAMEHKKLYVLGNATIASMAVAAVAAVILGPLPMVWPIAGAYMIAAPAAALGWRRMIRRKLATHKLMPTSQPLALPAAGAGTAAVANKKENAYDLRRRRNKSKHGRGSGGGVRAVFMTFGGHFYQ